MSSVFQPKNKILANIKVKRLSELANKDGSYNNINILGKVTRGLSSAILSQTNKNKKSYN